MNNVNILLFDNFESLDAFGPVEIIGKLPDHYSLEYYSVHGGLVTSSQNVRVDTLPLKKMPSSGILLIPGGMGTRSLVDDLDFIEKLKRISEQATYVLTVCTGSALLAKTGLLKNKRATTNKIAFDWVCALDNEVNWIRAARWVSDGHIYTSSGVSAGMDMTMGFISDMHNISLAESTAKRIEYIWNKDHEYDPFA